MSRLPKAPLIEVIFELRWVSPEQNDQYLHGDLYPLIKDKYPHRESIGFPIAGFPVGGIVIGGPTHRFRTEANGYPLVQIGPGVLTVNTIDAKYSWKEYEGWIIDTFKSLTQIYTLKESQNVRLTLQYIDLIKFDFEKEDVLKFLKENMNIGINQSFYNESSAKNVVLALNFENDSGVLNVSIARGKNIKGEDGIAIQTNLTSGVIKPEINFVVEWLAKAHELTSGLFKEMTKGKLQEMFASS